MTRALAILASVVLAATLAGCGSTPWAVRVGANLPGGYEPYVEVRVGGDAAEERDNAAEEKSEENTGRVE